MKRGVLYLILTVLLALLLLGSCAKPASAPVSAEEFYKGKTIEFVVGFNPGGGFDMLARVIAPFLERHTGATVTVKNIPGGGGTSANNSVFAAKPDGLTILVSHGPRLVTYGLFKKEG